MRGWQSILHSRSLQDLQERHDYLRVELRTTRGQQKCLRLEWTQSRSVRTIRSHGIVRICHGNHTRENVNLVTGDSVRVASPIESLMMMTNNFSDFGVIVDLREDLRADNRMLLNQYSLRMTELSALLEDSGRNTDLSDVVNEPTLICKSLFFFV